MAADIDLRYPIGKAVDQAYSKEVFSRKLKDAHILDIRIAPMLLENAILNLDEHQLDTPYRPEGWTVRQVIHHVADSHMNAVCRFKLALTEENPTIKGYEEAAWAKLSDSNTLPVNISLTLLHALHLRWVTVLESMNDEQWNRKFFHPEHKRFMVLWEVAGIYAWHGKHHAAHITSLRERMGW